MEAEELGLSQNIGRPVAEGIPGGGSSSESTPKTQVPCNRPIDFFFKPIHSFSLFFFFPNRFDGAAQKDNCLEMLKHLCAV